MEHEGLRADVILVDAEKDKKLSMLKQLILALVKGLNSNAAAVIKKIAGLVGIFLVKSYYDLHFYNFHKFFTLCSSLSSVTRVIVTINFSK